MGGAGKWLEERSSKVRPKGDEREQEVSGWKEVRQGPCSPQAEAGSAKHRTKELMCSPLRTCQVRARVQLPQAAPLKAQASQAGVGAQGGEHGIQLALHCIKLLQLGSLLHPGAHRRLPTASAGDLARA